jgi:spermidine synthase
VLRWKSVERCVMVDIDGEVVDACRRHLPEMHQGAFDDPRLELVIGDARQYVAETEERWDVVISDLSDPIEHGPSFQFFTREYFAQVAGILAEGGVFTLQAGPAAATDHAIFVRLLATVRAELSHADPMRAAIPSFGTPWGFIVAAASPLTRLDDVAANDAVLREHVDGALRFLDGTMLRSIRAIPPFLRELIAAETGVYTLADPPKFGDAQGIVDE